MSKFGKLLNSARKTDRYWVSRVKYDVAAQLQDLLYGAKLTQEKYAQKLGVKAPQVSRALNGENNPTLETLVKMSGALGYVPQVTFVPLNHEQIEVPEESDRSLLSRLNIAETKATLSGSYRFELPFVELDLDGWSRTNDERFELAA